MEEVADQLPDIVRVLQASDVVEIEIKDAQTRIRLHRRPVAPTESNPDKLAEADLLTDHQPTIVPVASSLVGTFYRASIPGAPPLVQEGSRVEEGTIVGIIEALQVLTEVEAGHAGIVVAVLATDGQPVEYGQVLFQIAVDG